MQSVSWEIVYYETESGQTPIEDFLNALPKKARAKCLAYIGQLEERGLSLPASYASKLRGHIWELRPEWSGTEYRFFYAAIINKRFVMLHAVAKKSQKLKPKDLEVAETRYDDVVRRESNEKPSSVRQRTS
jgi:phage-related protein